MHVKYTRGKFLIAHLQKLNKESSEKKLNGKRLKIENLFLYYKEVSYFFNIASPSPLKNNFNGFKNNIL